MAPCHLGVRGFGISEGARGIQRIAQAQAQQQGIGPTLQCRAIGLSGLRRRGHALKRHTGFGDRRLVGLRRQAIRGQHDKRPLAGARPGVLEGAQGHHLAFHGARAQENLARRQVVAHHHGVVPQGLDGQAQVEQHHWRLPGRHFAQQRDQIGPDAGGNVAMPTRCRQHLDLQTAFAGRHEHGRAQHLRRNRHTHGAQCGGQRGRAALVDILRKEGHLGPLHTRRQVRRWMGQQGTGLLGRQAGAGAQQTDGTQRPGTHQPAAACGSQAGHAAQRMERVKGKTLVKPRMSVTSNTRKMNTMVPSTPLAPAGACSS